MNDEGAYMFTDDRGKWRSDTPEQRRTVVERLRTWNAFSNSSPIEGIVEAIRTYYDTEKKISLYVFGDEFTGPSIDSLVYTSTQFATLMRTLCERNGGTFVSLGEPERSPTR